jgi:peptidoglycan/LPS O-acetylase OafA/YrhL
MDRLARNNFDLLRLVFAGTVCLVHAWQLSGFAPLQRAFGWLSSEVAVQAFFVVSGFLIFMSCERSSSLASYAEKRVRRIYPAYATVVLLCAVGLVFVSTLPAAGYFTSGAWWRYLLANLAFLNFLQPALPGVFEGNPAMPAVNGALWTLKIEVMFYATVPVFAWLFRRFGTLSMLALGYALSVAYMLVLGSLAQRTGSPLYAELARQLPGQLSYFLAGAFFYYHLPLFERRVRWFVAAAVATLAVHAFFPLPLLQPFALATLVVAAGLFCHAGNFGRHGDFSYGVYILHFPVIQLLLHSGWFRHDPWLFLVTTLVLVGAGAVALWHLVERRFLLRSSHYVQHVGADDAAERAGRQPA